jgi:hypothetical protein
MRTVVVLTLLLVACRATDDGRASNDVNPAAGTAAPAAAGDDQASSGGSAGAVATPAGLAVAFGAPRLIAISAYQSRALVVEAVYQATALSGAALVGRVANTGTISVSAAGAQYLPQPADRLVVEWGGQRHEFVVRTAQGNNLAPTSDAWLASPHVLSYSHSLEGQGQADIDVEFDGSRFRVQARGTSLLSGESVTFDLTATGASGGVRDYQGQDVTTSYAMTGSLRGDGYEVAVDEQQTARMVAATSLRTLPSQRGSASSVTTRISSVVRGAAGEIAFDEVTARSDLSERGGSPRNLHHEVAGRLLRNGAPWGEGAMTAAGPVLNTKDGVIPLGLN